MTPSPLLLFAVLVIAPAIPAAARQDAPSPDLGPIALDRDAPVVDATIADIPARLAVALDARDTIELAPAFSPRPNIVWQSDSDEEIGRVRIKTRMAGGEVALGGVVAPRKMTTHDRPCCQGQDGEVGPLFLPWSTVRIGTAVGAEQRWPADYDEQTGLFIPVRTPGGAIRVILSLHATETVATASAAAMLATAYGGHFEGEARMLPIAFGVQRQVRDMVFDRPVPLLGFAVKRLAVRFADFAGRTKLPQDTNGGGIVVRTRGPAAQHEWPVVTLGRDWLDRCPSIAVYRAGPEIGMACPPA